MGLSPLYDASGNPLKDAGGNQLYVEVPAVVLKRLARVSPEIRLTKVSKG